jgi:hypothetical protein
MVDWFLDRLGEDGIILTGVSPFGRGAIGAFHPIWH